MLVLAAPQGDDPRDDGYNHAVPGELLRSTPDSSRDQHKHHRGWGVPPMIN